MQPDPSSVGLAHETRQTADDGDDTFYFHFCLLSKMCTAFFNSIEISHGYFNGIEKRCTHFRKQTRKVSSVYFPVPTG